MENKGTPYPEFLAFMAEMLAEGLMESCGLPQEKATDAALAVTEKIRSAYGGDSIYIPKAMKIELSMRDHEILKKCKYMTYEDIAKEYKISTRRIYQIRCDAMFASKGVQPFLPLGDDDGDKGGNDPNDGGSSAPIEPY